MQTMLNKIAQVLGITCDNATNNDAMVEELAKRFPHFKGQLHRARCFVHILNLVVKSIMRLFDVDPEDDKADLANKDLLAMGEDIESDLDAAVNSDDTEEFNSDEMENGSGGSDGEDSENDMLRIAIEEELAELDDEDNIETVRKTIVPVKHILAKVCGMIISSSLSNSNFTSFANSRTWSSTLVQSSSLPGKWP
jgi:hypothetical protein